MPLRKVYKPKRFNKVLHLTKTMFNVSPLESNTFIIPVTRRVKGYTRFVGKYVPGKRKRFRPHKEYIFLIRISSRVDLAMSVCPYERRDLVNYTSYNTGFLRFLRSASFFQQSATPTLTPTNRPKL